VHLGTIRVNNQLDALFNVFILVLYMFRATQCSSSGESIVGGRLVCRSESSSLTCIPDGHLHGVIYTRWCIDTIGSPDDEHRVARKMYRSEINVKECVKLVINTNFSGRHYISLVAPNVTVKTALECMLELRVDSNFLTPGKEIRVNMQLNCKNRKWKISKRRPSIKYTGHSIYHLFYGGTQTFRIERLMVPARIAVFCNKKGEEISAH